MNIKDILYFAKTNTDIQSYLPSYDYDKFSNCDWLCNVINTIANKKIEYILQAMDKTEKLLIMKRELQVEAVPEFQSFHSQKMYKIMMKELTFY